MALTRQHSEERQRAILKFFMEGGLKGDGAKTKATGEEALKALTSGRLTGKKETPMGLHMLFRLQRQAFAELKNGHGKKHPAPEQARPNGVVAPEVPPAADDVVKRILERARELKELIASTAGSVLEVRITPQGAKVRRLTATEEEL